MRTALVLDGRSRAALAIVRSLGKQHIDVTISDSYYSLAFHSKYSKNKVIYPDVAKFPEKFFEWLEKYLSEHTIDVVIPVRDHTMEACVNNLSSLSKKSKFCIPSINAFNIARDKEKTIILARKLNIPHPKTILPSEIKEYNFEQIKQCFNLPIILKPSIGSGSRGIETIHTWDEFESLLKKVTTQYGLPLIQEFIPYGGAYGVEVLMSDSITKAKFAHKRVHEYPLSGGPSTLREGVIYPEIEEYGLKLLKELKWNGVAMVEYRVNKVDNKPYLMEINPRFWGSLQTGIFSGVDFPYLLFNLALNNDCDEVLTYEPGKQCRWLLFGDILWFIKAPKTIENIRSFFKFKNKKLCYDIISKDDLKPSFGIIKEALLTIFNRKKRKHIFQRGW